MTTNSRLADLFQLAERSTPPVRATALMRIGRLQTAVDRDQARRTFERGLEEARQLSGRYRDRLLQQTRLIAAAVAPDLISGLPFPEDFERQFQSEKICRVMLEHNLLQAAHEYVMHYPDPASFPFFAVESLLEKGEGYEGGLTLLRRAVGAWRITPTRETTDGFLSLLFGQRWELLPEEEARAVAREIVAFAQSQPDEPEFQASYQSQGGVTITSMRANTLFQILHVLRRLDPALAESLIAEYEQLAAAARRFPHGMETIHDERQLRVAGAASGGFGMGGSEHDFAYMEALMQDSGDGDFGAAMELALEEYREDTAPESPNQAPREFWPSTYRYRSMLYRIGKERGRDGAVYLDRIPDDDLRLFAEIEFEAALAGLPELNGIQMKDRPWRSAA